MQPETKAGLDAGRIGKLRLGSLKPDERETLFDLVTQLYLSGPKLADVARQLGLPHRSLQRFMTTHDREGWLIAQEAKQWGRVEVSRERQVFDEKLHNSAGYRMDRIERERTKLR